MRYAVVVAVILVALITVHTYSPNTALVIHFINLDRSPDRMQEMTNQLRAQGCTSHRWKAVDGEELSTEHPLYQKYVHPDMMDIWGGNVVGCLLSHVTLWKHLSQSAPEADYHIICEDDAVILPNFKHRLATILAELPTNWEFVFLGSSWTVGRRYSKNLLIPKLCYPEGDCNYGGFGYMLSKRGLTKILGMCHDIETPMDVFHQGRMVAYICHPRLIDHNSKKVSTIYGVTRESDKAIHEVTVESTGQK